MIGKPYTGKPSVRFDEGELEIGPYGYYASSLLYCYKQPDGTILLSIATFSQETRISVEVQLYSPPRGQFYSPLFLRYILELIRQICLLLPFAEVSPPFSLD